MIHKFTIEIEMGVREGVTREQAEEVLVDLIDHGMIYSIGMNHAKVFDDGYPYIFDYDILDVKDN